MWRSVRLSSCWPIRNSKRALWDKKIIRNDRIRDLRSYDKACLVLKRDYAEKFTYKCTFKSKQTNKIGRDIREWKNHRLLHDRWLMRCAASSIPRPKFKSEGLDSFTDSKKRCTTNCHSGFRQSVAALKRWDTFPQGTTRIKTGASVDVTPCRARVSSESSWN